MMGRTDRKTEAASVLSCRRLTKVWTNGTPVVALRVLEVDVVDGEILAFIGPSGCGKSTLLSLMAGLEPATEGDVVHRGHPVARPAPERCLIYQEPSLFPWMSVLGNVEFPLQVAGVPKKERRERAQEVLEAVRLSDFQLAHPHQLSGGMQQRVAVARALVIEPDVLLMDEPFGALDAQTRERMQKFLLSVWKLSGRTIVLVTHHIDEAITLADRIFVMTRRPGTLKELISVDLTDNRFERNPFGRPFLDLRRRVHDLLLEEAAEEDDSLAISRSGGTCAPLSEGGADDQARTGSARNSQLS